ncbi:DUF3103 family protein [Zooshikella harenae]|uniref:DUF3103 family protein n=1 Tax=Zooshikella harenae TaxID=2827238 RepID=A0ABS5ZER1_9GAMM|nr:DUF3103 family protein [Zooshikella harenae]MBU2712551.1 DUF3103 family protein [Zooshikella harenae]
MRKTLAGFVLSCLSSVTFAQSEFVEIAPITRELAKDIALQSEVIDSQLRQNIHRYQQSLSLQQLTSTTNNQNLSKKVSAANLSLSERKGIATYEDNLLQIRLADKSMLADWEAGDDWLVAYVPDGNEQNWSTIEAFDKEGNVHYLDPNEMPDIPVFVIDINSKKDLQAGLKVLNQEIAKAGLKFNKKDLPQYSSGNNNQRMRETAKLTEIRLNKDHEPWVLGSSEIYAIVSGINPTKNEAVLSVVDMPYLDEDKKTYYPNQIMLMWGQYRFGAANIMLYEHDDNYNYKELSKQLIGAVSKIVSAAGQPEIGILIGIGQAIVEAMPDNWFSNEDDYVDSFYTLERARSYSAYYGASSNAQITLVPYTLPY